MDCKVVVEHRPIIGSCQFFVQSRKLMDVSEVVVDNDKIFVNGLNKNIVIINVGSMRIINDSISGLKITRNSVQFRIRIEPNKIYGCFKNEMIVKEVCDYFSSHENYKPEISPGKEVIFSCRQCSTPLIKQPLTFRRVLPLPTTFDTGDFFCHGNSITEIKPQSEDCLYGLYFIQININMSLLNDSSDKVIKCHHCHSWLGVREKLFAQFWNSSVKVKKHDKNETNVGLSDFISVIKHLIKKENAFVSKVILYSKLANNETHYLLIWVIEKSLSLLTNEDNTVSLEVFLTERKVSKILYRYENKVTDTVKKWENEVNSWQMQISKQMMTEGLAHLRAMSTNIPEEFRKTNQMDVSYIMQ